MQRLQSVEVQCVTVTPMFISGAEQGQPEIRASAIRGALRYWLRAALGGLAGADVRAVRREEARVFGAASDHGEGAEGDRALQGVSAVSVVMPPVRAPSKPYERARAVSVSKGGRTLLQPTGRDYLYWSMTGIGGAARPYVMPGSRFQFTMGEYPGRANGAALAAAMGALWLLTRLGGIGSRSRRAAGNIAVTAPDVWEELRFGSRAADVEAAAQELASGIETLRKWLAKRLGLPGKGPVGRPSFDVLAPSACRIWVLGLWPTWDAAVETMGAALRDFRTYREPDHANVRRWARGERIATVERAAFGLPLLFRYKDHTKASVEGRYGRPEVVAHRRASPLWLSVWKLQAGYAGIATLFESSFLPEGAVLVNGLRPANPTSVPSGYGLVVRFIEERFPNRKEVRLV